MEATGKAFDYQRAMEVGEAACAAKVHIENRNATALEIIGESSCLKRVLEQMKTVAGTEKTVFFFGGNRTGEEKLSQPYPKHKFPRRPGLPVGESASLPCGGVGNEKF